MAKAKNNGNGRLAESVDTLKQSMTALNQAMAAFLANQTAFSARMAEADVRMAEMERLNTARLTEMERTSTARLAEMERLAAARMAEIDKRFARIEAILLEHSRMLLALPDAIRDKIASRCPSSEPVSNDLELPKLRDLTDAPETESSPFPACCRRLAGPSLA